VCSTSSMSTRRDRGVVLASLFVAVFLASCAAPPAPAPARPPAPVQAPAAAPAPAPAPAVVSSPRARNWDEYSLAMARKVVAINPSQTYTGPVPQPSLAIPVLEIELNSDGSVRSVGVLRQPTQARDTVKIATDAVLRAAPYGDVSHLPKPWKVSEAFLFRDDRRFKPRAMDQ
jgi:hypothetical protein